MDLKLSNSKIPHGLKALFQKPGAVGRVSVALLATLGGMISIVSMGYSPHQMGGGGVLAGAMLMAIVFGIMAFMGSGMVLLLSE